MPLIPVGCILMAKGVDFLLNSGKNLISKLINIGMAISLIILMLAFGWYETRGFFNINHPEIIEAGKAVDKLTENDARVIAPYSRDPAFLYQTNRNGWSALDNYDQLEQFIDDGATHYVSVNFDEITNKIMKEHKILEKTDDYVIIEFTR
jgi:hypothetical protein